ncbi:MBL fold metallo-hydrolase [Lutispora thermophila]|uniref:Glyoxylase, beta-lactamase superfamily II n=1 Tax=Lutispora thermophila DSM 19022 TaxID=1122184 RepID=A0A1M6HNY4_9FIRM|nr:MBL fold metallo-hydrolase [Lutispora thermophila]SHJ23843.1 Glyoxylase, beta-lactamase superfamily II [Lutispora thermophila DSM 19022]
MNFKRLPLGIYQANCYIIWDEGSKKAAVIDPGGDFEELNEFVESNQLSVQYVLLTHGHGDHIGAVAQTREKYKAEVMIHKDDYDMLKNKNKNYSNQMGYKDIELEADKKLEDGDVINLGSIKMEIIHTPGHTKGSICIKYDNIVFSGDTLFAGSIGRTDLGGGSFEDIIDSITNKLLTLPDNTEIYPGHGPSTTIGVEKKSNPFLKD